MIIRESFGEINEKPKKSCHSFRHYHFIIAGIVFTLILLEIKREIFLIEKN